VSLSPGSFLAVEGAIGVGKSSLAKILAEEFEAELLLESASANPFLSDFYRDPRRWALQTQITFLLQRHRQLSELQQLNLFHKTIISDYLFEKDRIFAGLTLQEREYDLYNRLAEALAPDVPDPDVVIYLQAPVDRLLTNIKIRDIAYERQIEPDYLQSVCEAYNRFFIHWERSPLLIVNATRIDFVKNLDQRERLVELIKNCPPGTTYFNPEA